MTHLNLRAIGTPLIADLLDKSGKRIHIAIIAVNSFAVFVTHGANFSPSCPQIKDSTLSRLPTYQHEYLQISRSAKLLSPYLQSGTQKKSYT